MEPGNGFLSIGGDHAHIYRKYGELHYTNPWDREAIANKSGLLKARLVRTTAHLISLFRVFLLS